MVRSQRAGGVVPVARDHHRGVVLPRVVVDVPGGGASGTRGPGAGS
jgi:hypothetical protein